MKDGDFVKLNYTGRLEDGTLFDTTSEEVAEEEGVEEQMDFGPKTVILGAGHIVEGLEEGIKDAEVGEEGEIKVDPENGFGEYDDNKIQSLPKREFKKKYDEEPRKGKRVNMNGQPGTIISTVGGRVRVDLNHPLAGKALNYEYEVVEKIKEDVEKIKALIDLYGQNLSINSFDITVEENVAEIDVPLNASFNQSWMMAKRQVPQEVFEYTDLVKIRFIEEYEKPSEDEGQEIEEVDVESEKESESESDEVTEEEENEEIKEETNNQDIDEKVEDGD